MIVNTTLYRDRHVTAEEWIWQARIEVEALRSMRPLRRALLPFAARGELDAMARRIDVALAKPPSTDVAMTLEDEVARLRAVRARAEDALSRAKDEARCAPPPAPADADEVVQFEHEDVRVCLVRDRAGNDRMVCARVPNGATFTLRTKTFFDSFRRPHGALSLGPDMDEIFVVTGARGLVDELLDTTIREIVVGMSRGDVTLSVVDGVVELAWRARLADAFISDALHVVGTIARRLYEA